MNRINEWVYVELAAEAVIKIIKKTTTDQKFFPISRIIGPRRKLSWSFHLFFSHARGFSIKL